MLGNVLGSRTTEIILEGLQRPAWSIEYMPELQWTTTPPVVPGLYWVCDNIGVYMKEYYVWESRFEAVDVWTHVHEDTLDTGEPHHWLGPLPVPAPPVDADNHKESA